MEHERRAEVRALVRRVEEVLRAWNPIGLPVPADEYDGYAPRLARMLLEGAGDDVLANELVRIEAAILGASEGDHAAVLRALRALADQ